MDPQIADLVKSAVEVARDVLPQIAIGAAGGAAWERQKAVWSWIKDKVSGAGRSSIVEQVEQNPGEDVEWKILSAVLEDLLKKEPGLAEELSGLLRNVSVEDSQIISNTGDYSNSTQIKGDGNTVIN